MDQDFFSVFAIFFPSGEFIWFLPQPKVQDILITSHFQICSSNLVTGLQAGANISGDLKDPAKAIPKGTLLALFISAISYAVFVVFAGGAAMRDAPGLINGTNPTVIECIATKV